jgi:ketosteroid isomerase-like protein
VEWRRTLDTMTVTAELLATRQTYADAYCGKNIDALMELFDDGDDSSVIGTGQNERCSTREQVRELFQRNFAEATATRFEFDRTHVIVNVGVIAATLVIHLDVQGQQMRVPLRWTVAAVRTGHGWLWLHRHASSPASGQPDGAAYPTGR